MFNKRYATWTFEILMVAPLNVSHNIVLRRLGVALPSNSKLTGLFFGQRMPKKDEAHEHSDRQNSPAIEHTKPLWLVYLFMNFSISLWFSSCTVEEWKSQVNRAPFWRQVIQCEDLSHYLLINPFHHNLHMNYFADIKGLRILHVRLTEASLWMSYCWLPGLR